jgi:cardiolipin synthase
VRRAMPSLGDAPPGGHPGPPWFQVGTDAVRLLRDGAQAFPAMLEAIEDAKREVLLEMYWIGADAVGTRFRAALASAAGRGADVRVIHDAVGSFGVDEAWWRPLRDAGGRVAVFRSLAPWRARFDAALITRRDHRKVLAVDGQHGFTGGINLARDWLSAPEGGAGWRDDMIELRGSTAQELRTLFFRTWRKLTGEAPAADVRPLSRRRKGPVWVLASQWRTLRSIHREYLLRIRHAQERIDLANPYFVPDWRVRRALFAAVERGVRVRVLVPGKSDVPVVQYAVEALFDTLLRHGVEVWTLGGSMLHSKTAIIDDSFATIGSYNLDERSWLMNLEVNLAVEDAAFARHVREWFDVDLGAARQVSLDAWRNRSMPRRALEWAAFAARRLL